MPTSAVVLSSGMQSNLLSLQVTARGIARSQERLATGMKVNSALDDPPSYFAARSLNNRASDLMGLKDAMAQAISTVKAADTGVRGIEQLVEHAKGLTTAALQNLENDAASRATRKSLAQQYDALLQQIDKVAADSGYGGKNLLNSVRSEYQPSADGTADASSITGVRKAEVTNATADANYSIRVHGYGEITATETSMSKASETLGLERFRLFGFNSREMGNIDDVRISLRRQGVDRAELLIQDGGESDSLTLDIGDGVESQIRSYRKEFKSGAWVAFDYDAAKLAEVLDDKRSAEVSVQKLIDLTMDVTSSTGQVVRRSLASEDPAERIAAGENAFTFDGGTLRLTIDPNELQMAAEAEERLVVDGPLAGAMSNVTMNGRTADGDFELHYEEYESGGVLVSTPVLASGLAGFGTAAVTIARPTASGTVNLGLPTGGGSLQADMSWGTIEKSPTSRLHVRQLNGGAPSVLPVGDYPVGWSDFSSTATLTVAVGAADSGGAGYRSITVTDSTGATGGASIGNTATAATDAVAVKLSGGLNDGAKMLIAAPSGGGAYTQQLGVYTNSGVYQINALGGPASVDLSDSDWAFNIAMAGTVTVTTGANNSSRLGYRTVTIQPAGNGANGGTHTFEVTNAAAQNQTFFLSSGDFAGTALRFDFGTGAGSNEFALNPAPSGIAGPTTVLYRAQRTGETAEIQVQHQTRVASGDDLFVQVGRQAGDTFRLEAQNVTTGGTGLGLDRSVNGWSTREDIEKAMGELNAAGGRLRTVATALNTGYGILTVRESFAKEFGDVLVEGANKLTLIDQNAEGATLLALQTRQQLGTITLSLANRSQQSLLTLFG